MIECLGISRQPSNQTAAVGWAALLCPPFFPPKGGQTKRPFTHTSIFVLLALLVSLSALADDTTRHYRIPAQSLADALMQFATDSNLRLLLTAEKVRGMDAKGIDGSMTQAQALARLLQGSGMTYRFVDAGTVTIDPSSNFKKTAVVDEKPQSNNETGSDTTLPKVTVEADASYDPDWAKDPYNPDYVLPNATTGTKTDTPVMQTPLNVQSISKQVLKDQQVISLDKALRNVSGVTTVRNNGAGGTFSEQIFLRGFATSASLRNGFRDDSNQFTDGVQFSNVESVEVLKGAGAILYGRVEPGGMVNIITKQPRATPYYSFNQQFGSYDLYRSSIDATGPLTQDDTLLYRVNASFQSNNSFRDLISGEDVFFAPILKWNISPRTQATLEMQYNRALSNLDVQALPIDTKGKFLDIIPHHVNLGERNPLETEQLFVGFNWSHQFNDDWTIKHQVAYNKRDDNNGLGAVPLAAFGFWNGLDLKTGQVDRLTFGPDKQGSATVATNLDLVGHFKTWGVEHTLLFGGDYYNFDKFSTSSNNDISSVNLYHLVHPGTNFVAQPTTFQNFQTVDNYGLYVQDQVKLPYDIHFTAGLRYQYIHVTGSGGSIGKEQKPDVPLTDDAVTPRFGLLWQPKNWLSLYSNYSENFGANIGKFRFGGNDATGNFKRGLPLESTGAQQWEVGAKTEFFGGKLRATVAYYDLRKQNVATADRNKAHTCISVPGDCSLLTGEIHSRGPELDIQGEILPGWNVIATYTNLDIHVSKSNNGDVGDRLAFTPRNVASFWSSYEVQQGDLKGFKIGGGVTLQDSSISSMADENGNSVTLKNPHPALVSLMAGYGFQVGNKAKVNLQLNIENLLDETYFTDKSPSGIAGFGLTNPNNVGYVSFSTPRTFMGSINVEY